VIKNIFFSIPYNGDNNIVDIASDTVNEIYGATNDSGFLNGRSSSPMPKIGNRKLSNFLLKCNEGKIHFNYTLNAPWQGIQQFDKIFYDNLYNFLGFLSNIGVWGITITLPSILMFSKKYFPNLFVTISKFARVNSIQRLRYWEDLGADRVCLDGNITKNLNCIKTIVDKSSIDVQLLVNDACLPDCPFENCHSIYESIHSHKNEKLPEYKRYFSSLCKYMMYKDLSLILRSTFIRPEDINAYNNLGVNYFKIVDRNKPTWWIKRVIKAYLEQSYDSNLGDILSLLSSTSNDDHNGVPVFIDNKKLDGYLNKINSKANCVTHNTNTCEECGFCKEFAKSCIKRTKENTNFIKNTRPIIRYHEYDQYGENFLGKEH